MFYSFYPTKDATLIEASASMNTGIDAILEIDKKTSSTTSINKRIVIQFDTTEIETFISSSGAASPIFKLHLWSSEATQIPLDYTLYCYPIYETWNNGIGREDHRPITSEGVSWYYPKTSDGAVWLTAEVTSSVSSSVTSSYQTVLGGGNWYTSSVATQSYSDEVADLKMTVTDMVNDWMGDVKGNYGFIIKRSDSDESGSLEIGSLKFFSKETHTTYIPRLEMYWDDSSYVTGSLSNISLDDDIVVYTKRLNHKYRRGDVAKIRIQSRPKYPTITFSTSSNFLTNYALPSSSYYEIRNAFSDEVIIPFDDDYTKLSCDGTGNYMKLYTNNFLPEEFYRIVLKVVSGSFIQTFDNREIFKVIR